MTIPDFVTIAVNETGRFELWLRNTRSCHCVKCEMELAPGQGHRFGAARYSDLRSGYICPACVATFLRTITSWHYNKFLNRLWPADARTLVPVDGRILATAFLDHGQAGIHVAACATALIPA
jgi:hypothetical protein